MPHPPLIQAMLQRGFYPHAAGHIRLQQTHASWIVLTGEFAYKLKKPVDFGFLDFSTLEKRKHFCEEELRLNRRLAPHLYLEVLPIGRDAETFKLGHSRDVCEYCLKMRQFGEDALLADRIADKDFDPAWMDELAESVADFHARAEQGAAISAFGAPCYLLSHIDASLNTGLRHPEAIEPQLIHALRRECMHRTRLLADVFEARISGGHIRDCHGDLHLGNIALFEGRPTIFDCIEFNHEYRAIDTLNDAAFLVMDCDARGHASLAFRFLSRYLEHSGDYASMPMLSLFLSYRAGVRGKVACLTSEGASLSDAEKMAKLSEAARYFTLASDHLHSPAPVRLHAVGGLSGSGKSRLSLLGCGAERAVVIRSDATRKRIAARHPDLPLYGEAMNRHTYQAMLDAAEAVLRAGWPAILDATFLDAAERQRARELADRVGAPFRLIWLDMPEDRLRHNILQRRSQGRDISDADIAVLEGQLAGHARPDKEDILFMPSADSWPSP